MSSGKWKPKLQAGEDVQHLELSFIVDGHANGTGPLEAKLNILLTYDLVVVLLDVYPKELETDVHTRACP